MAHWFGTVAAVRELGLRGVPVFMASPDPLRQAMGSKYVSQRLHCPDERRGAEYVQWLLRRGDERPGVALCAASDDLAFLYSAHALALSKNYRLFAPPLPVLREVLDKSRLHEHARRVGLRSPPTVFPADAAEARSLARGLRFPQLVKQRTQVFSRTLHRGTPVARREDLPTVFEAFVRQNPFGPEVLQEWPDANRPMLQEYLARAARRILCISGFLAPRSGRAVLRAASKVLSHPRFLGIGLLFEHAEVPEELGRRVLELCRSVGYAGLFQCEFLEANEGPLLTDFNPRFYNYMAFDHARGLPQAYLSYLLAIGAHDELDREIEAGQTLPADAPTTVYRYRTGTALQLGIEGLFRRLQPDEAERWKHWGDGATRVIDPVRTPGDPGPAALDLTKQLWSLVRHPRSTLRRNLVQ
jgi:hypothetical protein